MYTNIWTFELCSNFSFIYAILFHVENASHSVHMIFTPYLVGVLGNGKIAFRNSTSNVVGDYDEMMENDVYTNIEGKGCEKMFSFRWYKLSLALLISRIDQSFACKKLYEFIMENLSFSWSGFSSSAAVPLSCNFLFPHDETPSQNICFPSFLYRKFLISEKLQSLILTNFSRIL